MRYIVTVFDIGFGIRLWIHTLISTRCNCHFFGTIPIGYEWFEVVCGGKGLGSGYMSVGRAYVTWFWGWDSSSSCCLRCFGRGSLAVYQWVLGLPAEEVNLFTCCEYGM